VVLVVVGGTVVVEAPSSVGPSSVGLSWSWSWWSLVAPHRTAG
jgi:hypothetical protein